MKLFIKINVFCSCYLKGNFCVNPPSTPEITIETNILKSECFCESKKQFRKGFLAACTAIWGGMIIFLQNHLVSPLVYIFFCRGLVYKKRKKKGSVLKSLPAFVYFFSFTWCSNRTSQRNFN